MAVFNPPVAPTNDPNWLGWSKPISQPGGDKSTGIALGETGDILAASLKLADTSAKSILEDQIYTAAKAEQSRFTKDLQTADDAIRLAQTSKVNQNIANDAAPLNLLNAQTGPDVPPDLKNLPITVDSLGNARANGKLDPTPYYARLDALAKDFRARYPGYRSYIDEVMQKASGVDPANKYIQSVTADINSFATNLNSEKNKVISWATNHEILGLPGMQNKLNEFLAGKATAADVYNAAAPGLQQKYKFENNMRIVNDIEGEEKIKKLYAGKAIDVDISSSVADHIDKIVIQGAGGPQKVTDWINANRPGVGSGVPDTQWATIGQIIEQDKVSLAADLRKKYSAKGPGGQPSALEALGEDAINKKIEGGMKWHDMQLSAIQKKDTGLMFTAAMMTKAESDGVLRDLMTKEPRVALMKAFNDVNPQWASTMYSTIVGSSLKQVDKAGLVDIATQLGLQPRIRLVPGLKAPTAGPDGGPPKPQTLSEALDSTLPNPSNPDIKPGSPQLTKAITKLPAQVIMDPKAPDGTKINFAIAAFDPTNDKFINKIEGIGNKYSVFTDMTAPGVTKELKRLSTVNAEGLSVWNSYKRWVGNEFGNQLFNKEILSLNSMQEMSGVNVAWDNRNHRFEVDIPRTQEMDPFRAGTPYPTPDQARYVKATINRLNSGLASVREVYKADDKDPNAYVLGLLKGQGYQPGFSNLGMSLQRAVISSHAKPSEGEGGVTNNRLPYSEGDAPSSGTLGDFLGNPVGRFERTSGRVIPNSRNNAPAGSLGPTRGTLRGTSNLSNEQLLGISSEGSSNDAFSRINPNY